MLILCPSTGNYIGGLKFQCVVLIKVRREEGGFVGQGGRVFNEDSGIKFYNLQIISSNNCLACYEDHNSTLK